MANASSVEPHPLKKRNDLLQELRGLAAVLIFLFHANDTFLAPNNLGTSYHYFGGIFRAGYSAVDFFFVLSDFLMVYVHRREEGQAAFRGLFFLKRFSRIYPPFWAAIALLYPALMLLPKLNGLDRDLSAKKMIETVLLLPQDTLLLVPPAWSLTYEVFFYLVFGIFFFARRHAFPVLGLIWFALLVTASASPSIREVLWANKWLNVVFGTRNIGFLGGCLVGYYADRLSPRFKTPMFWLGGVIFLATWVVDLLDDKRTSIAVFTYMYAAASSLIVLGSTSVDLGTRRWMLVLGDASYSIYITHMSGMALMIRIGLKIQLAERVGLFATATAYVLGTIAVGVAFHYIIERPLMAAARTVIARVKRPPLAVTSRA